MLFFMLRGIYPNENFILCSKELIYGIPCLDRTYKSTLYQVIVVPKHFVIVMRKVRLQYYNDPSVRSIAYIHVNYRLITY